MLVAPLRNNTVLFPIYVLIVVKALDTKNELILTSIVFVRCLGTVCPSLTQQIQPSLRQLLRSHQVA